MSMQEQIERAAKAKEKRDPSSKFKELKEAREALNNPTDENESSEEQDAQATDQDETKDDKPKSKAVVKEAAEQTSDDDDGNRSLTVEERLDLMDQDRALYDLKLQQMENQAQKWENLAQRRAGELDYLSKSKSRAPQKPADDDIWSELTADADETEQETQGGSVEPTDSELYVLEQAGKNARAQFLSEHGDEVYTGEGDSKELDPAFVEIVKEVTKNYDGELNDRNPRRVHQANINLLLAAKLQYQISKGEALKVESRKRRAITSQKARDRKVVSQTSESSASSTSTTDGDKSIEEMSKEEFAKTFIRNDPRRTLFRN